MDKNEKKPKKLDTQIFTCGFDTSKNKKDIKKTVILQE